MELGLEGKAALVTGSSRGIGRGIALALAEEGCDLLLTGRDTKALEEVAQAIHGKQRKAAVRALDLREPSAAAVLIETVRREFGGLDILVNNAGLVFRKRFSDSSTEDWRKQIDTCLYGALNCCHSAGPLLEASGRGRIISIMGDSSRVGESGLALAAAARAGTIALMKSLAREWGRSGVTANSISLGLIETAHDKAWVEANREKLVKAYAIRRLGQPSDVAPMVALLASDAGSWITGQTISISGGFSMI